MEKNNWISVKDDELLWYYLLLRIAGEEVPLWMRGQMWSRSLNTLYWELELRKL